MTSVIRKLWILVNLYMERALYVIMKQFHEVSYANVGPEVLNSQSTIISAQIVYQLHLFLLNFFVRSIVIIQKLEIQKINVYLVGTC